jgi:hypothetical protein
MWRIGVRAGSSNGEAALVARWVKNLSTPERS